MNWIPSQERSSFPKYSSHTNEVINSKNVLSFKRTREAYYPDNNGIPIIRFTFIGGTTTDWYFDSDEKRDHEFRTLEVIK